MRRRMTALAIAAALALSPAAPAHALFGIGDIVLDPSNLAQNVLTARATMQELQTSIAMLQAQARDLTSLGYDATPELTRVLEEIAHLQRQGEYIAYQVEHTADQFRDLYPDAYAEWSLSDLAAQADRQWEATRAAWQSSLVTQSAVMEAVDADLAVLDALSRMSDRAVGNLAATQSGNQLRVLAIKQDMQLQQMIAAYQRAELLQRAREAEVVRQGRERTRRFLDTSDGMDSAAAPQSSGGYAK